MRRSIRSTFVLIVVLTASSTGCGSAATATTPTTPTVTTVTDAYTGTLTLNGAATHSFAVSAAGNIVATLTTVSDKDLTVGFGLGTWNGTTCQVVLANDTAKMGTIVIGASSGAGNLCVRIYDVGKAVAAVTYEISVIHP